MPRFLRVFQGLTVRVARRNYSARHALVSSPQAPASQVPPRHSCGASQGAPGSPNDSQVPLSHQPLAQGRAPVQASPSRGAWAHTPSTHSARYWHRRPESQASPKPTIVLLVQTLSAHRAPSRHGCSSSHASPTAASSRQTPSIHEVLSAQRSPSPQALPSGTTGRQVPQKLKSRTHVVSSSHTKLSRPGPQAPPSLT